MKVARQFFDGHILGHVFDYRAHLARRASADRVGDRDLITAHREKLARYTCYLRGRNIALVRATEANGNIAAHAQSARESFCTYLGKSGKPFVYRAVRVAFGKRFGSGAEHNDFIAACFNCSVESFAIRHEHGILHARLALDAGHDSGVVCHLRHPFRRHERSGFHDR